MTKTPKELTAEWKAGKLVQGWYFCKLKNGLIHHFEFNGSDFTDLTCHILPVAKILAPCNYDEYKAMQEELAEHRKNCCCLENENKELKRLLKECKDRFIAITTNIPINLEDCDLIRRIHQEVYDLETELLNERKTKKM